MARLSSDANSFQRLAPNPDASSQNLGTPASSQKRKSTDDPQGQPEPKKRGRPKKNAGDALAAAAAPRPAGQPTKKRGRPSLGKTTGAAAKPQEQATPGAGPAGSSSQQQPVKRGRGRPSLGKGNASAERPSASNSIARPIGSTVDPGSAKKGNERQPFSDATNRVEKRPRGRPSLGKTKKPGTPSSAVRSSSVQSSAVRLSEQKARQSLQELPAVGTNMPKRKRGRPSLNGKPASRAGEAPSEKDDVDESEPLPPPKPYAHVAPQVHYIQPSVINAKWSALKKPSLATAIAILSSSQIPIMQRMSTTTNRRTHTGTALKLVNHRITRKLTRGLPFPPSSVAASSGPASGNAPRGGGSADAGRVAELDFEKVLDGLASMERQLEPALASVEVLRREMAREERQLERDYGLLKTLEAGAKNSMREKRNLLKRAHELAPEAVMADKEEGDGGGSRGGLKARKDARPSGQLFCKIEDDEEVKGLAVLLSGHVDSIGANMGQLGTLSEEMDKTRGMLRDKLIKNLSVEGYEKVVLGM